MAKILVLYSTTDGHTVEICKRIRQGLQARGNEVELRDLKDDPRLESGSFDKIVIGASIRYGKHQPLVDGRFSGLTHHYRTSRFSKRIPTHFFL